MLMIIEEDLGPLQYLMNWNEMKYILFNKIYKNFR